MAFLLYRAGALDMVTRHQAEYAWKQISSRGWRTREPQETDFPYEEPTAFPELLHIHGNTLGYDLQTIGNLIVSNVSDVQRLYQPYLNRRGLYAIK